jgi:hypothetical protein
MAAAQVRFVSAADFGTLEEVATLYTATFQEYYTEGRLIPVSISAADLAGFVAYEQIDLALSPVMLLGDEPVGLVTVGLRAAERGSYCRGFGIVPSQRGAGLGVPLASRRW